jgi:PEGA domain
MPMRAFLPFWRGLAAFRLSVLLICMLILLVSAAASAQSPAENPQQSSAASAASPVQTKSDALATPPTPEQDPAKPQHLAAPLGPPSDLVNRQALEQHAGKNACKLLLRSTPSTAQVFVDGAFVGNSPLELVVAPGKYQIEMRGQRLDSARRVVDLLPRETREVALSLTARYPTHVTAQ